MGLLASSESDRLPVVVSRIRNLERLRVRTTEPNRASHLPHGVDASRLIAL